MSVTLYIVFISPAMTIDALYQLHSLHTNTDMALTLVTVFSSMDCLYNANCLPKSQQHKPTFTDSQRPPCMAQPAD